MNCSVVIPTYNRANTLKQCLEYLQKQQSRNFEVIVIDDGSTDETKQVVAEVAKTSWLDLHYHYQKNKKQGSARNLGIQKAKNEIILFLGDDILALPHLIENHLEIHNLFPYANIGVLGHTTWSPFSDVNEYMLFLEWSGWQFNYPQIEKLKPFKKFEEYKECQQKGKFLPPSKQHFFFYTSNLSLKKELLLKENFDEKFQAYGWEDVELGQRLTQKENLHLFYNPQAEAYHEHLQTEDQLETKMQTLANSLNYAPQLKPKFWKIVFYKILLNSLVLKTVQAFCSKKWYLWFRAKKIFYENLSR